MKSGRWVRTDDVGRNVRGRCESVEGSPSKGGGPDDETRVDKRGTFFPVTRTQQGDRPARTGEASEKWGNTGLSYPGDPSPFP